MYIEAVHTNETLIRWHRFTESETQSKGAAELRNELNKARDILAEVSALRLEIQLKNGFKSNFDRFDVSSLCC